jgi:SAM-dependent methyltransferase
MPYASLVQDRVSQYISTDLRPNPAAPPTVVSDSLQLPFKHNTFDTVLCTQVLEHVRNPFSMMEEIGRILRPGGHVILTLPAAWPLHEEPYDFFRYTKYGLRELAGRAHLEPVSIVERGGGIMAFAQLMATILYDRLGKSVLTRLPTKIVVAPLLSLFSGLDRLFYYPKFTLGYTMVARKAGPPNTSA